jgi:hypothetical protein
MKRSEYQLLDRPSLLNTDQDSLANKSYTPIAQTLASLIVYCHCMT